MTLCKGSCVFCLQMASMLVFSGQWIQESNNLKGLKQLTEVIDRKIISHGWKKLLKEKRKTEILNFQQDFCKLCRLRFLVMFGLNMRGDGLQM